MIKTNNPSDPNEPKVRYVTIASGSSVAKLLSIPPLINKLSKEIKGYLQPFLKIDDILYNDNAGGFTFPKLVELTNELLSLTPIESKVEVLTSLKVQTASHRINKQNHLKYNTGGYIDKTVKRSGIHTEESRFVKVTEVEVSLKLNLLDAYEKWIDTELTTLSTQTVQPNEQGNSEFRRVYNAEVTPERTKCLLDQLGNIENNVDKLTFLINQKSNYLNNLSAQVVDTSGTVNYPNVEKGTPLFFDRIIQNEIDRIKQLQLLQQDGGSKKNKSKENNSSVVLSDFFKDTADYEKIMELLVTKEYCHADTRLWIDKVGGKKGTVVAIVKQLHVLGYYKDNICPSTTDIVSIALKTFGVQVAVDTVKRSHPKDHVLDFLPLQG